MMYVVSIDGNGFGSGFGGINKTKAVNRIKNLQKLLNERGANLKVDGEFGPLTASALATAVRGAGVTTAVLIQPGIWTKITALGVSETDARAWEEAIAWWRVKRGEAWAVIGAGMGPQVARGTVASNTGAEAGSGEEVPVVDVDVLEAKSSGSFFKNPLLLLAIAGAGLAGVMYFAKRREKVKLDDDAGEEMMGIGSRRRRSKSRSRKSKSKSRRSRRR